MRASGAHEGGPAIPFGPCARWHDSHAPLTFACGPFAWFAWHDAHAVCAVRAPEWGWWQPLHFWWPRGAVDASALWQLAHASPLVGLCVDPPWQLAQSLVTTDARYAACVGSLVARRDLLMARRARRAERTRAAFASALRCTAQDMRVRALFATTITCAYDPRSAFASLTHASATETARRASPLRSARARGLHEVGA